MNTFKNLKITIPPNTGKDIEVIGVYPTPRAVSYIPVNNTTTLFSRTEALKKIIEALKEEAEIERHVTSKK